MTTFGCYNTKKCLERRSGSVREVEKARYAARSSSILNHPRLDFAKHTSPKQQKAMNGQQLLVDGYIANMFGPLDAQGYHSSLLGVDASQLQIHANVAGWENTFLVTPPTPPNVNPRLHLPPWVLDYALVTRGTVIPQAIWTPTNQADVQRYVQQLCLPVFFIDRYSGRPGLPLINAAGGDCGSLRGANDPAPVGPGHKAQIRINWPGYVPFSDQIMIRDQTSEQNTVALEKFVQHVARKVVKFLKKLRPIKIKTVTIYDGSLGKGVSLNTISC
ncbi:hypothetical protein BC834DRAFT_974254 [Gloeopeniophorella convolvens]|nr:hypothetical protein BC834DRAFT_974254 [Gloeopeniophorella convolvens]